jgi:hypothetical protein
MSKFRVYHFQEGQYCDLGQIGICGKQVSFIKDMAFLGILIKKTVEFYSESYPNNLPIEDFGNWLIGRISSSELLFIHDEGKGNPLHQYMFEILKGILRPDFPEEKHLAYYKGGSWERFGFDGDLLGIIEDP